VTSGQRDKLVQERADLILGGDATVQAYATHFEIQMRRGRIRKLLCSSYRHFSRAGAMVFGVDPGSI
jgi:hypothetical protein